MLNKGAPEFVVDQNLYYPAATNYGYYCTGFESPGEWEDHHLGIFGVDGYGPDHLGAQTDPYVYYNHGYAQSPYNPYNPYIPGALIGVDNSFGGGQHYYTVPSYQDPVSSPAYIPLVFQPDTFSDGSVDSFGTGASVSKPDGRGLKHKFNSASGNFYRNSSKLLSSQSSSLARVSEGSRANDGRKKDLRHTNVSGSNFLNVASSAVHQVRNSGVSGHTVDTLSNGNIGPYHNQLKLGPPSNSGFSDFGYNANGQSAFTKVRPKPHFGKFLNDGNGSSNVLGEQNRGPRISGSKHQPPVKAYTTKAGDSNDQGNIVIHADHYNREDIPVDYEDAKFFVIKSYSEDDVHKSIKYNVWSSTPHGNKKLQTAYDDAKKIAAEKSGVCPIFLFYSVNASGQFCGVAEMVGQVDFNKDMDFWQQDKWNGNFPVKWHMIKDVPNSNFRHIILENNENKPVTNSRDTQEVIFLKGLEMLKIFKNYTLKTSLLDDFNYYENRQKIIQDEKAKLLIKSFEGPLFFPALEAPQKLNFDIPPINDEKIFKLENDSGSLQMKTSISIPDPVVSKSEVTTNSADEKVEKTMGDKQDISSILKIGSVTITPKPVETKHGIGVGNKEPMNVVTVGSMQVEVNGISKSSGSLKVGSISLDTRALQLGKVDGAVKSGSKRQNFALHCISPFSAE